MNISSFMEIICDSSEEFTVPIQLQLTKTPCSDQLERPARTLQPPYLLPIMDYGMEKVDL